jgi:hypothetical protein
MAASAMAVTFQQFFWHGFHHQAGLNKPGVS